MPNHVTNIITYEGDRKQIAEMLEVIKNDELGIGTVDFQKIIPMPDDIYTGDLGPKERELYGEKNWYDWRRANWGNEMGCLWLSGRLRLQPDRQPVVPDRLVCSTSDSAEAHGDVSRN